MAKEDRGLVRRSTISNAVKNELFDGLNTIKELTLIDKSKLLDEALEDLIVKYEKKLGVKIL